MPKTKKNHPIIYAFIDSQNLNLGTSKNIFKNKKKIYSGWKLDFTKFLTYIQDKYKISKAFLFIGYLPENQELYQRLRVSGYELIFKPTLENSKGEVKGNVDAELVLQTMIEWDNYNKATIISGDGDFHCLIKHLKNNKKLSKIIIPNSRNYSSLLRKFRKHFVFIDNLKNKLEYKKRGSNLRTKP